MKALVFLGPTLVREEARREFDADYLDPVAQGDVYRAALERPFAIGIVDGYFERVPAVWHKEILWALSQRIHVFGAASMGALRAAELAAFGMQGVGAIFEAYHSGSLNDDDEVAVAHGDATTGYRAVSEAMVNVRATLERAKAAGVINDEVRGHLEQRIKQVFYADRSYPLLYSMAQQDGVPDAVIERLRQFVASGRIDQKRLDAIELLRAMRACCENGQPPPSVKFSFAHTDAWEQVVDWAELQPALSRQGQALSADLLVAEARLLGTSGRSLIAAAFNRAAAIALHQRAGAEVNRDYTSQFDHRLRQSLANVTDEGAGPGEAFEHWMQEQALTRSAYATYVERASQLDWFYHHLRGNLGRHVIDALRANGQHALLAARARQKDELLAAHGLGEPKLQDAGLEQSQLLTWYFETCLELPLPSDPSDILASYGLRDVGELEREALREYWFRKLANRQNSGDAEGSGAACGDVI